MGRIITIPHADTAPHRCASEDREGLIVDYLEERYPGGFKRPTRIWDAKSGEFLALMDDEEKIGDRDLYVVSTSGLDAPLWAWYIAIAVTSVAITFALQPRIPGLVNEQAAGSVYSVGAQANQAKIGGVIPFKPGRTVTTPEYASQSYRYFEDNEEVRIFLLCAGGGEYNVNRVLIGDTPVTDLPSGIVDYDVYLPDDHTSTLGVIASDFGIHENVATSGEVDSIELPFVQKLNDESINASATSGGNKLIINDLDFGYDAIAPGYDITISGSSAIDGTYTVVESSESSTWIEIAGTWPGNASDEDMSILVDGGSSNARGPFVVNGVGTTTQKIEIDIECPQGLFKAKDNGAFANMTVSFTATVQEIDDDGDDVGSPTTHNFSMTGATNTPQRETFSITKSAGRYKVSVERTDDQDIRARDAARTIWTGLKGYLDYPSPAPTVYGPVTLVAMKITGANEQISGGSQQRIRFDQTSLLSPFGTTDEVGSVITEDDMTSFTASGGSLASYGSYVPFGDASEFSEDGSTGQHYLNQSFASVSAGSQQAFTFLVKATGTRDWCSVRLRELTDATNNVVVFFDLSNGVVGTTSENGDSALASTSITSWGDGWYRIGVVATVKSGSSNGIQVRFRGADADGSSSYAGSSGAEYALGHYQFEATAISTPVTPKVASTNPADSFAEVWTNSAFGAGRSLAEIDSEALSALRLSNATRSGFNGVFDNPTTVWNALKAISLVAYSEPYPKGNLISVVTDEAKTITSFVTPDSIIAGTLKTQFDWFRPGDRDGIRIVYRDADTFEERYALWPDSSTDPERFEIIGLTDADEALSHAKLVRRRKTLQYERVSFTTELDALNYDPMDHVGIIAPVFNWSEAAHVTGYSTSGGYFVTLNKMIDAGTIYVRFRDEDGDTSAVITCTADGTNVIELPSAAPFTFVYDGSQVPTLMAYGTSSDFIKGISIRSVSPSGEFRVNVEASNYTDDLFTGLV